MCINTYIKVAKNKWKEMLGKTKKINANGNDRCNGSNNDNK